MKKHKTETFIIARDERKSKEYCVALTYTQAKYVEVSNLLLVELNPNNYAVMVATSDIVTGPGAIYVAKKLGAKFPLPKLISFVDNMIMEYIHEDIIDELEKRKVINKGVRTTLANYFPESLPF